MKKNKTLSAQAGDYVEIHLTKYIYEGILLETPRTPTGTEKGIVLLKLDSGYNIGFKKSDILEIKLKKKNKEKEENLEIKKDSSKLNVAMIITGGTIASRINPKKGGVDAITKPEDLFKYYPKIFDKVNVSSINVPFMKASENMNFKDWKKIAKLTEKLLNDSNISGVIITHGTDFLHYTASALSFMLGGKKGLNKPVVLTYSQRSIDRASSDANLNLQCSAIAAISDIAEVMLVGHASINDDFCYAMPGTKVRKLHSSRRDAFKVVNSKPIAKIFPDKIEMIFQCNFRNKNKVKADTKFEEKVALVKVYPSQDPSILDYYVKKKYKGIILEMSGLGHVPIKGKNNWIKKLKEVIKKGLVVCATSQCVYGRVDPFVYSNGREILETGVIYLEDMLAETALIKLGWILGHDEWAKSKEKVKEKMLENISGELNDRLEYRN